MPLNIDVPDELTTYLSPHAATEAKTRIDNYAKDLLREAGRLETTTGNSTDPQITSSMVADADLLLRRGYRQPAKNLWLMIGKIVSPTGALATGFFVDADKLKNPYILLIFLVLLIITVTSTVLVVVKE